MAYHHYTLQKAIQKHLVHLENTNRFVTWRRRRRRGRRRRRRREEEEEEAGEEKEEEEE